MARPTKKHGWRKIVVREKQLQWKYDVNTDYVNLRIGVQLESDPNKSFEIVVFKTPLPSTTPKFVREGVEFALDNGWLSSQVFDEMCVVFALSKFFMVKRIDVWKLKLSDLEAAQ